MMSGPGKWILETLTHGGPQMQGTLKLLAPEQYKESLPRFLMLMVDAGRLVVDGVGDDAIFDINGVMLHRMTLPDDIRTAIMAATLAIERIAKGLGSRAAEIESVDDVIRRARGARP